MNDIRAKMKALAGPRRFHAVRHAQPRCAAAPRRPETEGSSVRRRLRPTLWMIGLFFARSLVTGQG